MGGLRGNSTRKSNAITNARLFLLNRRHLLSGENVGCRQQPKLTRREGITYEYMNYGEKRQRSVLPLSIEGKQGKEFKGKKAKTLNKKARR